MPPADVGAGTINISSFPLSNVFEIDRPELIATPTTTSPLMSAVCSIYPKIKVVWESRANERVAGSLPPIARTVLGRDEASGAVLRDHGVAPDVFYHRW